MGRTASLFTRPGAGHASAQQGLDARIDLLMDVLDAAHPTIPCAVDALPAAARGDTARVLAALAQIGVVRLVDIGGGVRRPFALAHEPLGHLGRNVEIKDQRRLGKPEQPVLKAEKPVKKFLPLAVRQLGCLMHGVGGRVAVGDEQPAR